MVFLLTPPNGPNRQSYISSAGLIRFWISKEILRIKNWRDGGQKSFVSNIINKLSSSSDNFNTGNNNRIIKQFTMRHMQMIFWLYLSLNAISILILILEFCIHRKYLSDNIFTIR